MLRSRNSIDRKRETNDDEMRMDIRLLDIQSSKNTFESLGIALHESQTSLEMSDCMIDHTHVL